MEHNEPETLVGRLLRPFPLGICSVCNGKADPDKYMCDSCKKEEEIDGKELGFL